MVGSGHAADVSLSFNEYAGVPCVNAYSNSSEGGYIRCTTGPMLSNVTQYPGKFLSSIE